MEQQYCRPRRKSVHRHRVLSLRSPRLKCLNGPSLLRATCHACAPAHSPTLTTKKMSEFSESYHLRSTDIADGISLLRRAGLKGYVFPPQQGWVSIVAEENSFAPDQRIVSENQGSLLHYVSAEDHGWSFALFEHQRLVCGYDCGWDDDTLSVARSGCFARLGHGHLLADQCAALFRKRMEVNRLTPIGAHLFSSPILSWPVAPPSLSNP